MDYRSKPDDFSSSPPTLTSPDGAAKVPNPPSCIPKVPHSPLTSRSSTGNESIISAFVSANTASVMNAFKPRQSARPMKSEPESTKAKDVPTSISTASNVQAKNTIINTEQAAKTVMSHRKPSLEVVKEQVAAAKRRLKIFPTGRRISHHKSQRR